VLNVRLVSSKKTQIKELHDLVNSRKVLFDSFRVTSTSSFYFMRLTLRCEVFITIKKILYIII